MQKYKRLRVLVLVGVAVLSLLLISAGHTEVLSIEMLPATVSLQPNGTSEVTLIARNISEEETLTELALEIISVPGIDVEISKEPSALSVAPQSFALWRLTVSHSGQQLDTETIQFQISFLRPGADDTRIQDVAVSSLDVSVTSPPVTSEKASLAIQSPITSLNENEDGWVYLKITNETYSPIKVNHISVQCPSDVLIVIPGYSYEIGEQLDFDPPIDIPGYQTEVIPIQVQAEEKINPGDVLLLFNVEIEASDKSVTYSGSLVESFNLKIGVLGESDILKVLTALPSMLFLPGFVFLLALAIIGKFIFEDSLFQKLPLQITKPEFWIISISVSLFAATIFVSNPLLERYSLRDISQVWGYSFLAGVVAGFILKGGIAIWYSIMATRVARRTPAIMDKPLELLKKLERQGLSTNLKRIKLKGSGTSVFLLQPEEEGQTAYWVGPRIMLQWKMGNYDDKVHDDVQDANDKSHDLKVLVKLIKDELKKGDRSGILKLEYDSSSIIQTPVKKNITDLELEGEFAPYIEFDEN